MEEREANTEATPGRSASVSPAPVPVGPGRFVALGAPFRWARRVCSQPRRLFGLAFVLLVFAVAIWIFSRQGYAWHHLTAGKHDLEVDHCRQALSHFQACLEIWPDDAATELLAARAARRAGDLEAADQYLTRCQATPSVADQAAFERLLLRACRGEMDAVGGFCQALLKKNHPDTPLILEALAQGELTQLRFAAAFRYLDDWLEREPDRAHVIFLKGRLQLQASNSQEALGLLRRAVELDPERDDARLMLAGLYLDLGQAQEALPHLEEVCRRQPQNLLAKTRLGQDLVLLGRPEEAIPVLDDVLRQRPDLAIALLERGKLALRDGDLERAEVWLQAACKREPANRAAHYQLLQCLKQRGKTTDARAIQQKLDKIDQDAARMREIVTIQLPLRRFDPDLQAELGELFLNAGAINEGVAWLNRALQLAPNNPRAHRALAQHYYALGQSSQAQHHRALGGLDPALPK